MFSLNPPRNNDDSRLDRYQFTQWSSHKPGTYQAVGPTQHILSPGVYRIVWDDHSGDIAFRFQELELDDLLFFQDSVGEAILQEVETFWQSEEKFLKLGLTHKRGYLLYGPQGSGKTCIVGQLIEKIIKSRNGIVFLCDTDPHFVKRGLQVFRSIEKNRFVMCIYEDIDAIIQLKGESEVLSLLDGESQIDNILNIATTNYPEKLDKRIINRPRRFDRIIKVDMPDAAVRKIFFQKKLEKYGEKISPSEIDRFVKKTEGFSFAALAEVIISVFCLRQSFDEVIAILQKMNTAKTSSDEYFSNTAGF